MPIAPPKPYAKVGNAAVYCGDCREIVPRLGREFQLIFADPPFNIGQPYREYNDRKPLKLYEEFTLEWLDMAWDFCETLALHGPDSVVKIYLRWAYLRALPEERAWINWHYRFGQCGRSNWIDSRCHLLVYGGTTWNPGEVLVDSDRAAVYGDKRVGDYERGGKRLPMTVWGIPSDGQFWGRVQGTNEERRPNHPNQLPEVYLARVLKAYTNTGDAVLEPFGGSGGLSVVAAAIGRYATVIDVSEANCASIVERLRKGAVRV